MYGSTFLLNQLGRRCKYKGHRGRPALVKKKKKCHMLSKKITKVRKESKKEKKKSERKKEKEKERSLVAWHKW
jgi:hypothetical protein